ncbi:hypothetical protein POPTR_019G057550v4 [Populus trichocarpa]|uniref:Uncharacterized protein n=1 Tax=Populus trichocarpa TaxID=3694 RepID=A0A3N7GBM1_POPTR|nr:hypothetical protein POPTR_019G057550v4 [Populus trichocarpa]
MEQQAELHDALNEALKKEIERLKFATGEIMAPTVAIIWGCIIFHITILTCFHLSISKASSSFRRCLRPEIAASPSHACQRCCYRILSHSCRGLISAAELDLNAPQFPPVKNFITESLEDLSMFNFIYTLLVIAIRAQFKSKYCF